jgi:hypothetical protein
MYNYYTNDISNNEKISEPFTSQSVTQDDISMNEIFNKMFYMYNNYTFNSSNNSNDTSNDTSNNEKILEPFYLPPLTNDSINNFNTFKREIESLGVYINFTAIELYNMMKNLELKASFLTTEQKSNRKKILTFIQNELYKFKDSGKLYTLVNSDTSKPLFEQQQSKQSTNEQTSKKWCYLYTDCNRTRLVFMSDNIQDVEQFNNSNFPIKSISSSGVVITAYTEPDFRGVDYKFIPTYSGNNIDAADAQARNSDIFNSNGIIDINCSHVPLKSLIITPIQSIKNSLSIAKESHIPRYMPPEEKENVLAAYTFFQNTIDLFLNDIDPITTCPSTTSTVCPTCPACQNCERCPTYPNCERCERCPAEKVCPVCPAEKICPAEKVCPVCPAEKVCPVCPAEKICPAEKVCPVCPAEKVCQDDTTKWYSIIGVLSFLLLLCLIAIGYFANKKQ